MDTTAKSSEPAKPGQVSVETSLEQSVVKATTGAPPNKPLAAAPKEEKKTTEGAIATEVKARVVVSDEVATLPGTGRRPVVSLDMTKPVDAALNIDKDTVIYLVYLLFKTNMIARNNLRNMIDQISKPLPDDVLKWLVNEAARAGR